MLRVNKKLPTTHQLLCLEKYLFSRVYEIIENKTWTTTKARFKVYGKTAKPHFRNENFYGTFTK